MEQLAITPDVLGRPAAEVADVFSSAWDLAKDNCAACPPGLIDRVLGTALASCYLEGDDGYLRWLSGMEDTYHTGVGPHRYPFPPQTRAQVEREIRILGLLIQKAGWSDGPAVRAGHAIGQASSVRDGLRWVLGHHHQRPV